MSTTAEPVGSSDIDVDGMTIELDRSEILQTWELNECRVHMLPIGLQFDGTPSKEDWKRVMLQSQALRETSQWAVADSLIAGMQYEYIHGENYDEAMQITGYAYHTLTNLVRTGRVFPMDRRLWWGKHMTVSHYAAVALDYLPKKNQNKILKDAYKLHWGRDDVRIAVEAWKLEFRPDLIPATPQRKNDRPTVSIFDADYPGALAFPGEIKTRTEPGFPLSYEGPAFGLIGELLRWITSGVVHRKAQIKVEIKVQMPSIGG